MSNVSGEAREPGEGFLQPLKHGIKGIRQHTDLHRIPLAIDALVKCAGADLAGGFGNLAQWPRASAGNCESHGRTKNKSRRQQRQHPDSLPAKHNLLLREIDCYLEGPNIFSIDFARRGGHDCSIRCSSRRIDLEDAMVLLGFLRNKGSAQIHIHARCRRQFLAVLVKHANIEFLIATDGRINHHLFVQGMRITIRFADQCTANVQLVLQGLLGDFSQVVRQGEVEQPRGRRHHREGCGRVPDGKQQRKRCATPSALARLTVDRGLRGHNPPPEPYAAAFAGRDHPAWCEAVADSHRPRSYLPRNSCPIPTRRSKSS